MMSTPKSDEGRTTDGHDPVPEVREALPARPPVRRLRLLEPGRAAAAPTRTLRAPLCRTARGGARTARRGFAADPRPNADRHGGGGVLSAQCPHRARPGGIR
jgi:hypothetical protein